MAKKRRSKKQKRPSGSASAPKPSPDGHGEAMPDIRNGSRSPDPIIHSHASPAEEEGEQGDTLSPQPDVVMNGDIDLEIHPPNGASSSADSPLSGLSTDGLPVTDPSAVSLEVDDSVSVFSPIHYPTVSPAFRTERPFDSTTLMSSRSLWAEDLDYNFENGRRYCGNYYMPNDEEEQDRLRIVHQVYLSVFDLELTTVPLEDPEYILDIGTGTGEWAIGMGEKYPECEVVGTDISAIQPAAVPHNVYFEIDDAELEWTRPEDSADLIHMRHMAGAFSDWKYIYEQCFQTLKPGGYIELMDFDDRKGFMSVLSWFPPDSEAFAFTRDLYQASVKAGKPRGVGHLDPRLLIDAGFVDVTMTEHAIPLSPTEMSTGKLWLVACLCSLEAISLRLLTTYMGWDADRVRQTCDILAEEMKDIALNDPERARDVVIKVRVLVGKKPEAPSQWTSQNFHENGQMYPESDEEST